MRERNPGLAVAAVAAVAILYLLLIQPNHPGAFAPGALTVFPLELPVLVIALVLARGLWGRALAALVTGLVFAMSVLKLADLGAQVAYVRPFNPVLDLGLVPASWRLLSGTIGNIMTFAVVVGLAAMLSLVLAALWWATRRIAAVEAPRPARAALALALLPAAALAAADVTKEAGPIDPPGAAFTARLAYEHVREGLRAMGDLDRFAAEAEADRFAALPPEAILRGIAGTDILIVFIESYGRSALANPRYRPTVEAALGEMAAQLDAAGLAARAGFLTAPMVGGQSWLAHASLLSGLWIDNQRRYQALVASPRRTLMHLAQDAGWQTVAVMPAITLPWPEAVYFGYDRVLASADLGYRGSPFNWVTMPDQFTLRAFERLALEPKPRPPVAAEIALISSHAPWTPIPPILPWDTIGDGRVFDAHAAAGPAPEVVWRDTDRIRDQYRLSLDYTLRTLGEFIARRAEDPPLVILLGDHQPAAFVSEDVASRDVPVHIIGAPATVAALDGFGWTRGLVPDAEVAAWPMDRFRDAFLDAFSGPAATAASGSSLFR